MASTTGKTSKTVTVENSPKRYETAVTRAKAALAKAEAANWAVGDLALTVQSVYGASTVKQFAVDLDLAPGTVYDFRKVAEQYPADIRGVASWTVHQILGTQDDRAELVQQVMTTTAARELVKSRKPAGDSIGAGDGGSDNGDDTEPTDGDDLTVRLAKAQAKVATIQAALLVAETEVAAIQAEMDAQIQAARAAKAPRARRAPRARELVTV
jgi:hypothetical protein